MSRASSSSGPDGPDMIPSSADLAPEGSGWTPAPADPAGETEPVSSTPPTGSITPPRVPARTRSSTAYASIGVVLLILIVVLDFIIQNLDEATIHFFSASFRLPIGILVLGGAIGGGGIVLLVSLFRVLQLRRTTRRQQQAMRSRRTS
jgi:uncharacterized integral membrane protein